MTARQGDLFEGADGVVVYTAANVEHGDFVAYPACVSQGRGLPRRLPSRGERDPRDWLEVGRVEGDLIIGVRVNPQDWEADVEFHVYPIQLHDNGVELVKVDG